VFLSFRDRPFNLQGGGYGFLFRSEFFFRTTQELEYLFFVDIYTEWTWDVFFNKLQILLNKINAMRGYGFFLKKIF
jgi:hypothetical protein